VSILKFHCASVIFSSRTRNRQLLPLNGPNPISSDRMPWKVKGHSMMVPAAPEPVCTHASIISRQAVARSHASDHRSSCGDPNGSVTNASSAR